MCTTFSIFVHDDEAKDYLGTRGAPDGVSERCGVGREYYLYPRRLCESGDIVARSGDARAGCESAPAFCRAAEGGTLCGLHAGGKCPRAVGGELAAIGLHHAGGDGGGSDARRPTRGTTFEAFCRELQRIRYADGRMDGYASRNHYFSQWIRSNERLGVVEEIRGSAADNYVPFAAQQMLDLHYMSTYPEKYPMLKGDTLMQRRVRQAEREASGDTVRYIPRRLLGRGKDVLGTVHDGDILAIVTRKAGLDTSHLGFAVWVKGRLHLLNASSIHKKVVLEPMTLQEYMTKHPSQLGVRVVRIR